MLVSLTGGEVIFGPQVLPGGEWLLFTLATAATSDGWNKALIVVPSLKSGERKTLVSAGSDGRYLPTGLGLLGPLPPVCRRHTWPLPVALASAPMK